MADQNEKGTQFIDDLAATIAEQALSSIMKIDATVNDYVNKHLHQIIDAGLGVEKPWHDNNYRHIVTTDFIGPLKEFIRELGTKRAMEQAPAYVDSLIKNASKR